MSPSSPSALFFDVYQNGEAVFFARHMVEAAFGQQPKGKCWRARFQDGARVEIWGAHGEWFQGLIFHRFQGGGFYAALHRLMGELSGVLLVPGGRPVVATEKAMPHLPPDMLAHLGPAHLAPTASLLERAIHEPVPAAEGLAPYTGPKRFPRR